MKNIFKTALIVALAIIGTAVYAQKPMKIGYIDSQELIQAMPETDSVQAKLKKVAEEYETTINELEVNINRLQEDARKNQNTWTDLVKESKAKELQSAYQRYTEFQQQAQQGLQQEQAKLMQPVQDKARKAIDAVAKEQSLTYVVDAAILLYKSPDSIDILQLVYQKLGITGKKPTSPAAGQ